MIRYNHNSKRYEGYSTPWKVTLYPKSLLEFLNCAGCGKKILYKDSYTSIEIQTEKGTGYPVCLECRKKERL